MCGGSLTSQHMLDHSVLASGKEVGFIACTGWLCLQKCESQHSPCLFIALQEVQCVVIPSGHFEKVRSHLVMTSSTDDVTPTKVNDSLTKRCAKEEEQESVYSGCTASGSSGYGSERGSQTQKQKTRKSRYNPMHVASFMEKHRLADSLFFLFGRPTFQNESFIYIFFVFVTHDFYHTS